MESNSKWEKKVTAARYIMCGMSQREVASLVGVSPATVSKWTKGADWGEAMREASTAEFHEMAAQALGVVKDSIQQGDVGTAKWYLTRVHPVFNGTQGQTARLEQERNKAIDLEDMTDAELRLLVEGDTYDE